MLSVGNTAQGSGASLSLDTRATVGASVLAANTNVSNASATTTSSSDVVRLSLPEQQAPAVAYYNAYEFIYRSDYGKIILREQNVDNGQEVTQIPTEYRLQQYAATQRAQRVQQQAKLLHIESSGSQPHQGTGTKAGASSGKTSATAATTSTAGQGTPAPAPAPAAAPQVAAPAPAVAAAAAAPAHVDIKV